MVAPTNKPTHDGTILGGSLIAAQAALVDGFWTMQLRDGTVATFTRLEVSGDWLRLHGVMNVGSSNGLLPCIAVNNSVLEVRTDDVRVFCGKPRDQA